MFSWKDCASCTKFSCKSVFSDDCSSLFKKDIKQNHIETIFHLSLYNFIMLAIMSLTYILSVMSHLSELLQSPVKYIA